LSLFPIDPEVFGLLALMLLHQSRATGRASTRMVRLCCSTEQGSGASGNRTLHWNEGAATTGESAIYQNPGPYQLQAGHLPALHVRATKTRRHVMEGRSTRCNQALETLQPSPGGYAQSSRGQFGSWSGSSDFHGNGVLGFHRNEGLERQTNWMNNFKGLPRTAVSIQ